MKQDLLSLVANERKAAVGFDNDAVLLAERERSLEYMKGEMRDVPALPMRSKAVSTDVNDAIETLLPDLVEIFTGSDDVVAFTPVGEEDEEAAQQETDYINHVVFRENDGFMLLYAGFKDALSVKTGVWTWWWEDYRYKEEVIEVADEEGLAGLVMGATEGKFEVVGVEPSETSLKVTLKHPDGGGCVKIKTVPPEDFAVARDTVSLRDATYCAMRSRPRAQDLIADGYDEAKVKELPAYALPEDQIERARDTAGESDEMSDTTLRQVEIVTHFIKVGEGGKSQMWRLVTGADETVELDREKVDGVRFAAITPYPVAHRFYGRSVADILMEIQRIRTSLVRMLLDQGYFALNQRIEVAEDQMGVNTLSDLLRNEPGVPIRTLRGGGLKPVSAASLNFDVLGAIEFTSTMGEQRTGIIRNAQGLNPDTLHDTKGGMMQMVGQAQKRTRLIARIFAETGIKDLFLGVHSTIRAHATKSAKVRLRNEWTELDPTSWGNRNDMTIEIGVGAGGKEHDLLMAEKAGEVLQTISASPAGPVIVTPENVYNMGKRVIEKLGFKSADPYLTDPKKAPPQPPQPNPDEARAQADMEVQRYKIETQAALDKERMAGEFELKRYELEMEAQLKRESNAQAALLNERQGSTNLEGVRQGGAVG